MLLKKKRYLAPLTCFILLLSQAPSFAGDTLDWASQEGVSRLSAAKIKQDFFHLAPQFEGQSNKTFCGVASMVIIANTLRSSPENTDIPLDNSRLTQAEGAYFPKGVSPLFHRYSQESILKESNKTRAQILGEPKIKGGKHDYGMQLSEITALAESLALKVQSTNVMPKQLDDANYVLSTKEQLKRALEQPDSYVIANYSRKTLNQQGSGHFSPLAAYDETSDSFLIMDVSNTYQTWVWVSTHDLLQAMATQDQNKTRGFVIITEA
ncbi:phytochelatin synthase [Shewanella sp. VB17]|uniref:phytochelatin synthase family protein n=1 Tax=Shewanella sp. VB17 TaxID=2739432 RepID=UPI0015667897|nr:phytochelatin synthase family protein [Shewanella sp. VB17]NRD73055.1 phytochelatin synthase [Shewanella sp. VB17]